jgi:hypothetical protein
MHSPPSHFTFVFKKTEWTGVVAYRGYLDQSSERAEPDFVKNNPTVKTHSKILTMVLQVVKP